YSAVTRGVAHRSRRPGHRSGVSAVPLPPEDVPRHGTPLPAHGAPAAPAGAPPDLPLQRGSGGRPRAGPAPPPRDGRTVHTTTPTGSGRPACADAAHRGGGGAGPPPAGAVPGTRRPDPSAATSGPSPTATPPHPPRRTPPNAAGRHGSGRLPRVAVRHAGTPPRAGPGPAACPGDADPAAQPAALRAVANGARRRRNGRHPRGTRRGSPGRPRPARGARQASGPRRLTPVRTR